MRAPCSEKEKAAERRARKEKERAARLAEKEARRKEARLTKALEISKETVCIALHTRPE
jgi:hypothetical protein